MEPEHVLCEVDRRQLFNQLVMVDESIPRPWAMRPVWRGIEGRQGEGKARESEGRRAQCPEEAAPAEGRGSK